LSRLASSLGLPSHQHLFNLQHFKDSNQMKRLVVIALLILCCHALPANASTLQGLVREIHDGKTITVENTGRRIKVALKGVDVPEQDQPYGEVARQHLSSLILNQPVTIELTGLGAGSLLIGRVICGERDIALQMIRDGVGWFDKSYENDLAEADRSLYAASEQAARSEHRGIWQDSSPIPPWEWRQAKVAKPVARVAVDVSGAVKRSTVVEQPSSVKTARSDSTSAPLSSSASAGRAETSKRPIFSPSGSPFSIRIPSGGHHFSEEIEVPNGQPFSANFYWVNHLKIGYMAAWASGPSQDQAISALFDKALDALNQAAEAHNLPCEFVQEKDAAINGYVGRRYKVRGCYFHGGLRYYFKTEGKTLKVRIVGVMSEIPNDPSINQFLESFELNN
jgi:endonuclease YncB( thermonuclease family)